MINGKNILIVEDEEDILELVKYNLTREGYQVYGVFSGEDSFDFLKSKQVDLILLDIMLPGIDGLEVCRRIKTNSETMGIPIIMLTAKGEEQDIIKGLELGADDYVTKPFSPKVLSARINAVLRRKDLYEDNGESQNSLVINSDKYEVLINNKQAELTLTEFKVLEFLASKPGWVYSRYQIIDAIRGDEYIVTDRSVDVLIVGLRKKLGPCSSFIETVRGVGYRYKD